MQGLLRETMILHPSHGVPVSRFRLAHLSDPHLGPFPRPTAVELLSKRAFGYMNWVRARKASLGRSVLDRLVDDCLAQRPAHVAVTGDLVNVATPAEFALAAAWLARLGAPADVSVVPGNHDAYVPGAAARAAAAWAPYMAGDGGRGFPYVRRRGPLALIGVSTAVATPPGYASGRVGVAQRNALAALLDRHDDAVKVVLIHHPPDLALAWGRRRLVDALAVREVLAAGCADIVLFGHNHRASLSFLETPRGRAPVIGVPSPSSDGSRHPPGAYALLDVDTRSGTVRLTRRGLARDGRIRVLEVTDLPLPLAAGAVA